MRAFAGLLAVLAGAARAEPLNLEVANLLGAATVYFGEKAEKSRVVLVAGEKGDADLRIYVEDPKSLPEQRRFNLAFAKQEVAFSGLMAGTEASLAVTDRGSLVVKSQNIAIGRNKWETAITIVKKGGDYLVAGVTRSSASTSRIHSPRQASMPA